MSSSRTFDAAVHECYIQLYNNSEPKADFEKLISDYKKPCGFDSNTQIHFLSYEIDENEYNEILEKIIKEFNIPKHKTAAFRIHIALGISPKFKK